MVMDISIRKIGAADIEEVRGLLRVFALAFDDEETYCAHQPDARYFQDLISSDSFIGVVALHNNEVVGGLAAYELKKFEQARSEIYIYDLAVAEAYRRRGIATKLIEELQREAARRGAYVIYVQADYGDEPAVALYTKLGTREDVMHFDIAVPKMPEGA